MEPNYFNRLYPSLQRQIVRSQYTKAFPMDSKSLRKALILFSSKSILPIVTSDTYRIIRSIVAVHGLNGHREKTWTANNVNWLRDFLPPDIPNARIFSWGYNANTHSTSTISAPYLYDHAKTLVSDLCLKRRLTKVREPCLENDRSAKEQPRPERVPLSSSLIAWEE